MTPLSLARLGLCSIGIALGSTSLVSTLLFSPLEKTNRTQAGQPALWSQATLVVTDTVVADTVVADTVVADTVVADTSSSNDWVPIARISPDRAASLVLINDTNLPLEYSFSINTFSPKELPANDQVTLTQVPLSSTLLINATSSTAVLDYAFSSTDGDAIADENNTITVTISLVPERYDAVGFSAIDIHETGALYRY